jgi:N-acetylglucosaminyl-diphospho-decaprenol L-rhamnosyltransferase
VRDDTEREEAHAVERLIGSALVTIISVAFESAEVLPEFVSAAAEAMPTAEILIVDNGSTDGGVGLVATHPQVRVVRSEVNLGFGRACNLGATHARGRLLVFANPDLRLVRCDLTDVISGESVGFVAGAVFDEMGRPMPSLCRDRGRVRSWYLEVLGRLRLPGLPRSRRQVSRRPGYPNGALCVADAEEFRRVGGFDPRYFLFHEDRDIAKRYREAGLPLQFVRGVAGHHLHGSSSSASWSIARQGWSIISWLEYTGIWDGPERSNRLFRWVIGQLGVLAGIAMNIARLGVMPDAWRKKGGEYQALRNWMLEFDRHLPVGVDGLYPHALSALNRYRAEGAR